MDGWIRYTLQLKSIQMEKKLLHRCERGLDYIMRSKMHVCMSSQAWRALETCWYLKLNDIILRRRGDMSRVAVEVRSRVLTRIVSSQYIQNAHCSVREYVQCLCHIYSVQWVYSGIMCDILVLVKSNYVQKHIKASRLWCWSLIICLECNPPDNFVRAVRISTNRISVCLLLFLLDWQ